MTLSTLIIILAAVFVVALIAMILVLRSSGGEKASAKSYQEGAEKDVEHIFNESFREELRNRGRLQFEKILSQNAMLLQKDLQVTTVQLNDFIKQEVKSMLKTEFKSFEESLNDAKQLTIQALSKTQKSIEESREDYFKQLQKQLDNEKQERLEDFEERMEEVVNHYVMEAIGDQIDMNDQMEFILAQMDRSKEAIRKDIMASDQSQAKPKNNPTTQPKGPSTSASVNKVETSPS